MWAALTQIDTHLSIGSFHHPSTTEDGWNGMDHQAESSSWSWELWRHSKTGSSAYQRHQLIWYSWFYLTSIDPDRLVSEANEMLNFAFEHSLARAPWIHPVAPKPQPRRIVTQIVKPQCDYLHLQIVRLIEHVAYIEQHRWLYVLGAPLA